ncbi:hypothetical protein [Klebsiella variicola]|uniref:hypothetical protein n=1 Tax=Klebsiella variicola TaxID=244366 RepID=UPI0014449485|nr:hypothetical protein [Klebsiella variicola]NKR39183.1 hypothetical protein [Klebsiella variicola]
MKSTALPQTHTTESSCWKYARDALFVAGIKKPRTVPRLIFLAVSFLFLRPIIPPGIIEGKYRCIKLGTVNQDGARCQVKLDIVQDRGSGTPAIPAYFLPRDIMA